MPRPTLSIVTPSYNQAAFLEQTIRSVLSQDVPGLEYIVMDGGSTDGSAEIIRKYADRLSFWCSEKDGGQADGINRGIARTHGDIIAWLNSDDLYLRGTLLTVQDYFEENPNTDVLYSDVLSIDAAGKMFNVMRFAPYQTEDLMQFRIISQPGVFFRRSAWEKAGGLDLSYSYLLDHHLWLRMAADAKFAYLPRALAAARYHPEAKNRAHATDFGKEAYRLADWMLNEEPLRERALPIRKKILGAAAWLDAHYLSDGERPRESLKAYAKAFTLFPNRVLEDFRRVLLTALMAFSPSVAAKVYTSRSAKRLEGLKEYERQAEVCRSQD